MTDFVSMRTDHCGTLRASDIGREVAVCGWVARRREHGEHPQHFGRTDLAGEPNHEAVVVHVTTEGEVRHQ